MKAWISGPANNVHFHSHQTYLYFFLGKPNIFVGCANSSGPNRSAFAFSCTWVSHGPHSTDLEREIFEQHTNTNRDPTNYIDAAMLGIDQKLASY